MLSAKFTFKVGEVGLVADADIGPYFKTLGSDKLSLLEFLLENDREGIVVIDDTAPWENLRHSGAAISDQMSDLLNVFTSLPELTDEWEISVSVPTEAAIAFVDSL